MSEKPLDLIEKYLERVRVYLPIDSEDVLIEIRTHLLEEAESIGDGNITRGSVMMAIERFGEPKDAANAAAGTGKRVGPVPEEYTQPLIRMVFVLAAVVAAFVIGAVVIRLTIPDFLNITTWTPMNILTVVVNFVFVVTIVIVAIILMTRDKAPTEKTALEEFLDIGTTVIKPKPRLDALGDIVLGTLFGFLLLLPQVRIIFSESFLAITPVIIVLFLLGAFVGFAFYIYGENNLNLALETVLSVAWIFMCMAFINIGWPFEYAWQNTEGIGWYLVNLSEVFDGTGFLTELFAGIWAFIVFIIVVMSVWQVLVSSLKISMYYKAGKGLWWTGNFGEKRHFRRPRQ